MVFIWNPQDLGLQVLRGSEAEAMALSHHQHRLTCALQQIHMARNVQEAKDNLVSSPK